jgi:hypothetical protein
VATHVSVRFFSCDPMSLFAPTLAFASGMFACISSRTLCILYCRVCIFQDHAEVSSPHFFFKKDTVPYSKGRYLLDLRRETSWKSAEDIGTFVPEGLSPPHDFDTFPTTKLVLEMQL